MIRLLLGLTLLFSVISCKDETLLPLDDFSLTHKVGASVNFCTLPPEIAKSFVKIIFVIDKSRSNQVDTSNEPNFEGTDITGFRRYNSIVTFLDSSNADDTVSYALINFSTYGRRIVGFQNKADFRATVLAQKDLANPVPPAASNDTGWTNYTSALQEVAYLIQDDVEYSSYSLEQIIPSHYIVFFISDGRPETEDGPQNITNVRTQVENIDHLTTDPDYSEWIDTLKINTCYYYGTENGDETARQFLSGMIEINNGSKVMGNYYEFGAGEVIDFGRYATPERMVRRSLKDVFVLNTNVMWQDGIVVKDSDGDGISDIEENEIGSNSSEKDSDKNGVSDGVEFKVTGNACKDTTCDPLLADQFISCNSFIRDDWVDGLIDKFVDQDNDLLNNCEETALLNSRRYSFDSNDDWVPDELAFRNGGIPYAPGTDSSNLRLDPDDDGMDNYTELKRFTPWDFDNSKVIDYTPYVYTLTRTEQLQDRDCYTLDVSSISAIGNNNMIRVYLVEKNAIIDDKRFIRTAEKPVNKGETVHFTDADFK